jgi:hypothetical protein
MPLIDDILAAPPVLTEREIRELHNLAAALPAADDGGFLEIGDHGFATTLAIVILAGLEALDAG